MKKLLFLLPLLLVVSLARAQTITNTSAVPHTTGTPTHTPSTYGSHLAFDKANGILYQRLSGAWVRAKAVPTDGDKGSITVSSTGTVWSVDVGEGGIYEGSGTVPASTVATATNGFRMNSGASGQILLGDYGSAGLGGNLNLQGSGAILGTPGYQFRAQADDQYTQMVSPGYTVRLEPTTGYTLIQSGATNGYKFWDTRATPRGVEYTADYSATYNPRSLVDFGTAKRLISDSLAAASAPTLQEVTDAGAVTTAVLTAPQIRSTTGVFYVGLNNSDNYYEFQATGAVDAHATLTNANTDSRTYTLPDRSGTIRVGENYKVYTALLSQSGTSAPTATVLENTLGGTVVWTRSSAGVYAATLAGGFTSDKTWWSPRNSGSAPSGFWLELSWQDADTMSLLTLDGMTLSDDAMLTTPIEIRVYP